jgi:serine/threonine protein phosphatase 1
LRGRTIAIGDIHGCAIAFSALLTAISPQRDDTIVTLGDYVDRGIDSKGVIDLLIELERSCRLVPVLGNHEEMMLDARRGREQFEFWLACGGSSALASYDDRERLKSVPVAHWRFLERCKPYHVGKTHFFVHANYEPTKMLNEQDRRRLLWLSLRDFVPGPHFSGRIAIVGHTPQPDGKILDLGHLKCIDTDCCHGGLLTALDVNSGQLWQANERGEMVS